jgi:hypothetical protein
MFIMHMYREKNKLWRLLLHYVLSRYVAASWFTPLRNMSHLWPFLPTPGWQKILENGVPLRNRNVSKKSRGLFYNLRVAFQIRN